MLWMTFVFIQVLEISRANTRCCCRWILHQLLSRGACIDKHTHTCIVDETILYGREWESRSLSRAKAMQRLINLPGRSHRDRLQSRSFSSFIPKDAAYITVYIYTYDSGSVIIEAPVYIGAIRDRSRSLHARMGCLSPSWTPNRIIDNEIKIARFYRFGRLNKLFAKKRRTHWQGCTRRNCHFFWNNISR